MINHNRKDTGIALIWVVITIAILIIFSLHAVEGLVSISRMSYDHKAFIKAFYAAQSAQAHAIYYLDINMGIKAGDLYVCPLEKLAEGVTEYEYTIRNLETADWTYRIEVWGYSPWKKKESGDDPNVIHTVWASLLYVNDSTESHNTFKVISQHRVF